MTFTFENFVPGYAVSYVDPPIKEDGSGRTVNVAGSDYVQVLMQPASGFDLNSGEGVIVYKGPRRISGADAGTSVVKDVVRTGDFESVLTWTIGLADKVGYKRAEARVAATARHRLRQRLSSRHPVRVPERTHAERMASRDGYFPPESLIRRLGNSPVVPFLGGGPAVLLQVAHPLVAAGVTQHSDYRDDLWRRLLRTLRAVYLMAYGTKQEAEWAGEAVQRVHARVHGTLRGRRARSRWTPYRADDPALMLWVHATLVHSSLAVFTRFVARLDAAERGALLPRDGGRRPARLACPDGVAARDARRLPRVRERDARRPGARASRRPRAMSPG